MINLYTSSTPNGHKASVTLEELGLPYETFAMDLGNEDQKKEYKDTINEKVRNYQ